MRSKFIFVIGGVISGLGKGILTASIGKLLQGYKFSVTVIKIDPYLNIDAGTMRPTEHGEVWVTHDGGETDQDLGNYERFLEIKLPYKNNITSGKVLLPVLERERKGGYLGQTVQYVPHVTNEIRNQILSIAKKSQSDFVLVEIGGVVGDYENVLFLKAAQQIECKYPTIYIELGYLPTPSYLGEMKTKPIQHAITALGNLGIQPDIVIGRGTTMLDKPRIKKIAISCGLSENIIFSAPDLKNIYSLPLVLEKQGVDTKILTLFNLKPTKQKFLYKWKQLIEKTKTIRKEVRVGIVGKYIKTGNFILPDAYISVTEAIKHAAWNNNRQAKIVWFNASSFEKDNTQLTHLKNIDCLIIPGGFGSSGIEGKILAAGYCRKNKLPFLGLCLGLQVAVIEYARNVCKLKNANSIEFVPETKYPVITIIEKQKAVLAKKKYGASMRLGEWPATLKPRSIVRRIYGGQKVIYERHRHRYEVNPKYIKILEKNGLIFSGCSPDRTFMEFIELPKSIHPYFIATQAHPEFTSSPMKPNPLFDYLVKAALNEI